MPEFINRETFDHLVVLAALELGEKEAEYIRTQLNNQLAAIQELEAIPLDEDVPISLHGVDYPPEISAAPRPDEWRPTEDPAAIVSQAPQSDDGYIVVPDIPHTTLE